MRTQSRNQSLDQVGGWTASRITGLDYHQLDRLVRDHGTFTDERTDDKRHDRKFGIEELLRVEMYRELQRRNFQAAECRRVVEFIRDNNMPLGKSGWLDIPADGAVTFTSAEEELPPLLDGTRIPIRAEEIVLRWLGRLSQ